MAFRCNSCKKYTLHLDQPPCDETCRSYLPQEVMTIHLAPLNEKNQRPLTCTGKIPVSKVHMTSTPYGTTCPMCLQTLRENDVPEKSKTKDPPPSPSKEVTVIKEDEPEEIDPYDGYPNDSVKDIFLHADTHNLPALKTPEGLKAWIKEGNDITTIKGIGQKTKILLLQLLNLEEK